MSSPPLEAVRIFVGGTSDRNPQVLSRLIREAMKGSSQFKLELTIADGTGPRELFGRNSRIGWMPPVPATHFWATLAESHVCFLPLRERQRSAGQMVISASLEAGIPVVASRIAGLKEYFGTGITAIEDDAAILPTLLRAALADESGRSDLREIWEARFSAETYISSVLSALGTLGWPS
jgi:glycosyltransferase involved in cell wall biosynthesis